MFELTVLYILYTGLPFLNAIYSNCACFVKVKLYQFYSETDVSWADEKEIKKERKEVDVVAESDNDDLMINIFRQNNYCYADSDFR